jgi:Tol biopolymer transport system component
MPLAAGSRIGSHVVLSLIGEGGMGEVYRARDTILDRDVAIKRLPDAVANDPERLARFEREAKTLAALNHPNVAQIYAVDSGSIVMELVPGECLHGPVPLETALNYAGQIASALDAAHEKGIIHRDLKPGNVMITPDGVVKVLDFSLAARDRTGGDVDPERSPTITSHATSAGMILGTAAYMSPEQASGRPVDKRADIFAFGVVLWEMLTGRRLFEGDTISHVLAAVLTKEPDLTAVPLRVRPLLARCLEKDPKKRLRDIGDAMSLVPPAGEPTLAAPTRRRGAERMLALAGWVAAAVLAVVAAVLLWRTPTPAGNRGPSVVRFRIERALDIYNQTMSAFAVSPDGGTLAHYDAAGDGRHALFLRSLATGEARELPGTRTFSPRQSSLIWSPDGRHVVRGTQDGAFVVDVSSGAARRLCDCRFTGGSWNHDGVVLLGSGDTPQGIRRVSMTDATPTEITTVDSSRGEQDRWPVFLPDGRFLFTRVTDDAGAVTFVGALASTAPIRLVEGSYRLFVASGDERSGWLVGVDTAGVVARRFDAGTGTVSATAVPLSPGGIAVSGSETGVLVASAAGAHPRTVPTWFDRKGVALERIADGGYVESVALSPDGGKLVIAEHASGTPPIRNDIWVRDLAKGVRTRLTFNPGNDSTPVWSPDGTRVAYSSQRVGRNRLYQRAANGTGDEAPLIPYDRDAWPNDWSSDGRWVIFTSPKTASRTDNDLWVVPVSGGAAPTPVPYLIADARQQQAQFSPDGRFVAYGSDESGTFEIYVQPFPNASDGKWMVSSGGGTEPRWRRDGKELFYFSGQTLMAVPVSLNPTFSNGAPVALFEAAIQAGYWNDSDRWQVSPDGQRFLLLPPDGRQQAAPLDVIVNWLTLLEP